MARITKAQRLQTEADEFRALALSFLELPHNDWSDWEYDWLQNEVRRHPDYLYTEKERAILDKLVVYAKDFTHYGGRSVQELIIASYPHRADLGDEDEEFLERIHGWGATVLKRRQIRKLANICRQFGELDSELDEAA